MSSHGEKLQPDLVPAMKKCNILGMYRVSPAGILPFLCSNASSQLPSACMHVLPLTQLLPLHSSRSDSISSLFFDVAAADPYCVTATVQLFFERTSVVILAPKASMQCCKVSIHALTGAL